jgi:hypothetical protein
MHAGDARRGCAPGMRAGDARVRTHGAAWAALSYVGTSELRCLTDSYFFEVR